jgi:hypothetical protein
VINSRAIAGEGLTAVLVCRELEDLASQFEQERARLQAALDAAWRESEAHEQLADARSAELEEQRTLIAELTSELERLADMEMTMQVRSVATSEMIASMPSLCVALTSSVQLLWQCAAYFVTWSCVQRIQDSICLATTPRDGLTPHLTPLAKRRAPAHATFPPATSRDLGGVIHCAESLQILGSDSQPVQSQCRFQQRKSMICILTTWPNHVQVE